MLFEKEIKQEPLDDTTAQLSLSTLVPTYTSLTPMEAHLRNVTGLMSVDEGLTAFESGQKELHRHVWFWV